MGLVGLAEIDDRQHHEDEGLQGDHQDMEDCPAKMQRQLPDTQQRNQDENQFAGKHVAEQSQ